MKQIDLAAVENIIVDVASTEIMPRFRNLLEHEVEVKADRTSVTVADTAAERALIARLRDYLPGCVVVGEEGFALDPSILSRFHGDEDVWVIDPIDGTRNFIEGKPEFAVMIALVRRMQTVAAWIHDPNTGHTLMAEHGGGVRLRGNKMLLAGQDSSIPTTGVIGARLRRKLAKPEFHSVMQDFPPIEVGSAAAFDYGRLFTGDVLFGNSVAKRASFLMYRHSKPWDHVPGLLLLSEAHGYAADLRGEPYNMAASKNGMLLAADAAAWRELYKKLKPVIEALARPAQ
jgi:fructose-1,6-bisphosphatase/inositol monophosphatase family enzyme